MCVNRFKLHKILFLLITVCSEFPGLERNLFVYSHDTVPFSALCDLWLISVQYFALH